MADERDVLLALFKHYADVGVHHQGQASSTTNIVLTLAGVLIGLITFDQRIADTDHLAAYALMGVGLFGLVWSAKHHERYDYFTSKAEAYRDKLAALVPQLELLALETMTEAKSARRARLLYRLRVRHVWMTLHLFVMGVGLLILVLYYTSAVP